MKIRIKFSKYGNMKFIGHLDVMRYFQKAIRRADLNIRYSGGFSPHQIMSFAAPLGVGITSRSEYVDIELLGEEVPAGMKQRLNAQMAEGFEVVDVRLLPENAAGAMSIVAAADYTCRLRPGHEMADQGKWLEGLLEFYSRDSVPVTKKTKRGQKEMDLKPLIYELRMETGEQGPALFMKISNGSASNVKPEMVLDAYYAFLGEERPQFAWMFQREEVYADQAAEEEREAGKHCFVSLADLGEAFA